MGLEDLLMSAGYSLIHSFTIYFYKEQTKQHQQGVTGSADSQTLQFYQQMKRTLPCTF